MDVDAEGYEFEREAMISINNGNSYRSYAVGHHHTVFNNLLPI